MDYTTMPLMTQLATIQADVGAVSTLKSMAELWGKAATELRKASGDFQSATNQIEPNWTDDSGANFVSSSRESNKTIDTWAQNIASSQAQSKIDQVAGEIPGTAAAVQKVVDQYNAALATAAVLGISAEELELLFRPIAGAEMNKLAGTYQQATDAVSKARGGSWQGLQSDHAGARSVDDVQGMGIDVPVGPQGTGLGGADGAGELPGAGGQDGAGGEDGLGQLPGLGQDPSLSGGLGGAPVAPPALPPVAPPIAAPVAPGLPVGGMPPMMPGGFAGRGGGGGGGPRIPGVRLGGGGPVGAQPVNSPAAPTPASAPTVAALTSGTPATGSATAGVPPMMPPMGAGMGAGGARGGGIPGPGLARRKRRDGDDDEPPTPGLPAVLSGKAGLPDAFRFSSAQRTETDAPGTVQLIDEDLWHEEVAKAPVRSPAR